jgi:hypothetical protein
MLALERHHTTPQVFFYAKINDHGILWGNTGQILAQWSHPVASRVALDLLYWAISLSLHQQIAKAIKMASKKGAFLCHCQFCHCS